MKNANVMYFAILVSLLVGCKETEEPQKPKVSYQATKDKVPQKLDPTLIEVADLPIQMEGTNYLIYPIGDLSIYGDESKSSFGSSNSDRVSFKISNSSEYEITGFLQNLKFQEIGSKKLNALTDKAVLIQTITYLKSVADKTDQSILAYTLADLDTNQDSKIDTNDIKTLYISDISGNRFTKLTPDLDELIDWNLIEANNHLYFRSIEDTNRNGKFDKNDVVHYNYVDLNDKKWKVNSYKPV